MIYGLGTALGWGLADLGAAVTGRRIGSFATVLIAQVAGFACVVLLVLGMRPSWTGTGADALLLALSGAIGAVAYFTLYRGLELGPIALVSPIASTYAVVTIALAVLLLGERLNGLEIVGAALTLVGVVLTSADPRAIGRLGGAATPGVRWAFAASLLFGVGAFVVGRAAQRVGTLPTMAVSRTASLACLLAASVLLAWRRRREDIRHRDPRGVMMAVGVGLADIVGFLLYARGCEVGSVSITTAIAGTFTLVPVIAGIALLGERPAPSQLGGVALVVTGIVLLGLA